jgi:four helix bundle protein
MSHPTQTHKYKELEDRTTEFAKQIIALCKLLPQDVINRNFISQIIRSAGSIGANYREANESLGEKDFLMRLKISRKEAKETDHWLDLITAANPKFSRRTLKLKTETDELRSIFSAIIYKISL